MSADERSLAERLDDIEEELAGIARRQHEQVEAMAGILEGLVKMRDDHNAALEAMLTVVKNAYGIRDTPHPQRARRERAGHLRLVDKRRP